MLKTIYNFIGKTYTDYGPGAAIATMVVIVVLVLLILEVTGIDLGVLLGLV